MLSAMFAPYGVTTQLLHGKMKAEEKQAALEVRGIGRQPLCGGGRVGECICVALRLVEHNHQELFTHSNSLTHACCVAALSLEHISGPTLTFPAFPRPPVPRPPASLAPPPSRLPHPASHHHHPQRPSGAATYGCWCAPQWWRWAWTCRRRRWWWWSTPSASAWRSCTSCGGAWAAAPGRACATCACRTATRRRGGGWP